ncbi:MAG: ParB/RepB/Spo0J family partition protein [Planctomycetes bacterium]|nr:ParB/RepB/Spo0J family partition protein [Planctomycetota bacterium]
MESMVMERAAGRSVMGKGLDAILGDGAGSGTGGSTVAIAVIDQNPNQPRKHFDPEQLESLRETIKTHGVLQPLVVRPRGDRYELIAGERRLRAAIDAGLAEVPVRVVDFDDQQVMEAALVENIQRTDLNPIEKAIGFKDYLDRFQMTHEQLAARLGLARPTISNIVGLLDLPQAVQDAVRGGQISMGHAKVIKGAQGAEAQVMLCRQVISLGLSVHATEQLSRQAPAPAQEPARGATEPKVEKTEHVLGIERELAGKLSLKVDIRLKGAEKGALVVAFDSTEDFERIISLLRAA